MVFLSGPRQVGKTTVAKQLGNSFAEECYFSWDNQSHREIIVKGQQAVATELGLDRLTGNRPLCTFDELHKYQHWRDFLKGFFDQYENRTHVLVTGSASLETFRRGGDSLMGRYFPFSLHPVSVAGGSTCMWVGLLTWAALENTHTTYDSQSCRPGLKESDWR